MSERTKLIILIHYIGKNYKETPLEGIEPSTYGLEVHRAIHCAIGAGVYLTFFLIFEDNL